MSEEKTPKGYALLTKISSQLAVFNTQLENFTKIIEDVKSDKKELVKKVDAKAEKKEVETLTTKVATNTSFCDKHSDLELVKKEIDKNTEYRNQSKGIQQFIPYLLSGAALLYSIFSK